ncbi:MAG: efflux RND transporter periplasmic adaptor subunit [Candidatus Aminicenantes bacterium]|nr:efflux RND transporter periplasmic adaptor subunit [Candidatus Aminicenantes bacterium]NIM79526.1 efflux RND transporter periplasmic adaptor subunit [Candidatus Aminicenantes bacterium]NIN18840.1 efflux RND transporter periplasmic adaptor subunit [Candidatus Aminicenantes bacterium]NIN42753.1 efflux RND transporter periplasmic adaptor subunit [Candidatus Aminicenantes bacterium]NIN85480.1 efflux RND transporter periplasmic adaptor subunit [Candidatus Aminicenantes bacterium]
MKMKTNVKKIIRIVLCFSLLVSFLIVVIIPFGCSREKAGNQTQPLRKNPVKVKVQPVQRGAVIHTLEYKGTVFPWKRANIGPETSGRIKIIYKKQGDRVKKGDLLAELDTTTLKLQLKQAEAALEVAEAAHKDALLNVNRLKKLFQKNAISKMQLEKAELSLETAVTREKNARATKDLVRHHLDNAYMNAPFDGIITSKNSEEGDVINPMMGMGTSVLTLMHLNTVKVVLDVPSEEIEKITVGQPCTVQVTTLPEETFKGEVYSKNLAADPVSKTFKVEVKIENPQLKIKSGIFAEVSIEISRKENCLIVPLSAVIRGGDIHYVVLYQEGKAKYKNIKVGEQDQRVVEITDGLSLGQLVVVQGNYDLKEGALIEY